MWSLVLISIVTSSLVSLALVPIVRLLFLNFGIIDKPDAERKLQKNAVTLGGGLAVFTSLCATFAIVLMGDRYLGNGLLGELHSRWHTLFYSAAVLMLVGLADDVFTIRGRQKLLLQILIVVAVVGGGTVVQKIGFLGFQFDLGIFSYPLTVLWLLAAINALNLIDGADGMASTAGVIISGGLAILCVQTGSPLGAVVAATLCGSLLGFLVFNRPPASIYLGDAGSMVIGLFVGVLSIWGSVKGSTLLSVAPLLVLSLPLFDSSIAILRRLLTGRSIYATDRAHLHHRLLDRLSHPMMLVVVGTLTAITSAGSIISVMFHQQWIAFVSVGIVIGVLLITRSFGNAELEMLARRAQNFGESLLVRRSQSHQKIHQKSIQLQGNRKWDEIWSSLVEFAIDRELSKIKLDVSIAWMQEGYHGSWRRSVQPDKSEQICITLPIHIDDRLIGRLELIGNAKKSSIAETLDQLNDRFLELQAQIRVLLETVHADELAVSSHSGAGDSESVSSELEFDASLQDASAGTPKLINSSYSLDQSSEAVVQSVEPAIH